MTSCWPARWRSRLVRGRVRARAGRALTGDGVLRARALARFGHPPTASQRAALAEIDADLAAPRRMLRLLQGDVGSGKTLVALLAMLRAVEAGAQAALMAPTEVLAKQHHRTLSRLSPVPVALLTGSVKGARADQAAARRWRTARCRWWSARMRCSRRRWNSATSALAVIDEQHRFGVDQRLLMGGKGRRDRRAGDDRDADPAHAAADPMGRDGGEPADRKTRRAAADPHHAALARHAGRTCWRRGAQAGGGRAGLLGVPAGGRERGARPRRRGGALRRLARAVRRRGRRWRTAGRTSAVREAALADFAAGRAGCWWRPR